MVWALVSVPATSTPRLNNPAATWKPISGAIEMLSDQQTFTGDKIIDLRESF